MKCIHKIKRTFATVLSLSLSLGAAAGAAEQSTARGAVSTDSLEEIVVTAEKRASNLMTTAVALNALSGAALKERQVTDIEDLTAVTPSFTYDNQGPTSAVNIRGIGLSVSSPNVAPGVPIYRDGLLAPTLLPNEPFLDIADVEVLRGPQGTLVGSNSTGGAVFINTRNPDLGQTNGYAEVVGGSYNRYGAQGAYNFPVSDTIALRAAFSYERHSSYWRDVLPSSPDHPAPGEVRQGAARLSALWEPSDQWSVLFKVNYQSDQNGGLAHTPLAGTNAALGYPTERYVLAYTDPDTQYSDYQVRAGLEVKYHFNNGVTLRSMSGVFYTYEYYDDQDYVDTSPTTVAPAPFINRINDHVYSQEFNLLSPGTDRLHWVLGSFSQYWPAHVDLNPNTLPPRFIDVNEGTIKVSNAVFGDVGFDIMPTVEVHAGIRETVDHAWGTGGVTIPEFGVEIQSNRVSQHDRLTTGRIGVNWKATADEFAYAFAAKGGKTGGINGSGVPDFGPESVYDYEAGLKSTFAGGHLRTQMGVFFMKYGNLQLAVLTPAFGQQPIGSIANAGSSTVKGAELSMQSQWTGLKIDGNLSYVDSSVSSPPLLNSYLYSAQGLSPTGTQCAPGQTADCFNYAPYYQSADGVSNPYSPRWTANIGTEYAFPLASNLSLTPRIDFSFVSKQWATVFQNPVDQFQERKVVNLHLTLSAGDWLLRAYGTNVTHQYFIVGQSSEQNLWNAPAEYGLRITKSF